MGCNLLLSIYNLLSVIINLFFMLSLILWPVGIPSEQWFLCPFDISSLFSECFFAFWLNMFQAHPCFPCFSFGLPISARSPCSFKRRTVFRRQDVGVRLGVLILVPLSGESYVYTQPPHTFLCLSHHEFILSTYNSSSTHTVFQFSIFLFLYFPSLREKPSTQYSFLFVQSQNMLIKNQLENC